MKIWLYRIIATAAIVEIVYLIPVNLALNLPFTQTLINQHKPEKYTVIWEEDIVYYQRPRPKPHKDYAATRDFFPPIRDREIDKTPVMPVPKKKGDGWEIIVEDIHASGSHRFWVFQMQGFR